MNVQDLIPLYSDHQAASFIRALTTYSQIGSNRATMVSTSRHPIPGLPHVICDSRDTGPLKAPWGAVQPAALAYGSQFYSYLAYRLFVTQSLKPGATPPAVQLPQLAVATFDAVTRQATVYLGMPEEGTAPTLVENQSPIWEGRLTQQDIGLTPLATYQSQENVLRIIREELARAGVPAYPAELYGQKAAPDYPWVNGRGLPLPPARVANDEISVPLLGYAVDNDTTEIVYLSMVGHKTACRSIWGSINTAHKRRLDFQQLGGINGSACSSHNYTTCSTVVDPDIGLTRLQIIDRRALSQDASDVAYLVIPKGMADADIYEAFAVRLNAVLPIGVLPAWGEKLRWAGDEAGLVKKCFAAGDVAAVYKIAPDKLWLTLIEELLKSGELTIS